MGLVVVAFYCVCIVSVCVCVFYKVLGLVICVHKENT